MLNYADSASYSYLMLTLCWLKIMFLINVDAMLIQYPNPNFVLVLCWFSIMLLLNIDSMLNQYHVLVIIADFMLILHHGPD